MRKTSSETKIATDASRAFQGWMLFWMFVIGSVLGYLAEGCWELISEGRWRDHVATVWGPFCLIYGVGASAAYALGHLVEGKRISVQFLAYALSGGAVEYFGSLGQEMLFGSRSWDYTNHFLNINGRVSLQMAVVWGTLGVCFMRFVLPRLRRYQLLYDRNWARVLRRALAVFMLVNLLVTSSALLRWRERMSDVPPQGVADHLLDARFGDERMSGLFYNMDFKI